MVSIVLSLFFFFFFLFFSWLINTPVLGLPRPQPRKRPCSSSPFWISWHPSLSPPHHRLWCAYIQASCSRRILQVLQVPPPSAARSRQCVLQRGHAPCRCESGFPYIGVARLLPRSGINKNFPLIPVGKMTLNKNVSLFLSSFHLSRYR